MILEVFIILTIVAFSLFLAGIVILLILDNRVPSKTVAWLLSFIVLPVLGPILYLFIGRNWRRLRKKETEVTSISDIKKLKPINFKKLKVSPRDQEIMELAYKNSYTLPKLHNRIKVYINGEKKFKDLLKDIKSAKNFINMEYFIWKKDPTTDKIKAALIERAKKGVKIRILVDRIGGNELPWNYFKDFKKAGIDFHWFFDFSLKSILRINYRDHRKIVNIDGRIGYVGGANIAQEYADGGKRFGYWRDTHLRIEGEIVDTIQDFFALNWFNTTKELVNQKKYYFKDHSVREVHPMQLVGSGPDSKWGSIHQVYFALLGMAQKSIYIQSPYFIPSPSIQTALVTAAMRGVDVRIIVTGKVDKLLPYWAAFTYFEPLLEAGVKICHYQKGFMHAKAVMIDSEIASIGTANMDVRSFNLNFEINTIIYGNGAVKKMEKLFFQDMEECTGFTIEDYNALSPLVKFRNSIARIFAPLM